MLIAEKPLSKESAGEGCGPAASALSRHSSVPEMPLLGGHGGMGWDGAVGSPVMLARPGWAAKVWLSAGSARGCSQSH